MSWYDEQVHYARVITYSNDLGSTSEGSIEKGEQELINQSMRTISKSLGEPTSEVISFHWSNGFKDISDTRIVKTKRWFTSCCVFTFGLLPVYSSSMDF